MKPKTIRAAIAVVLTIEASAALPSFAGGIDDYLFRYDFTSGAKVYSHNGHETEPVGEWSGFTAVNGPGGYGTAVHPCGVGTITDGENVLNNGDWTIAMSVKPGTTERGVFLSIGSGRCQTNGRDLCFLSSSTSGKICVSSRQTWGGQYYNEPSARDITDIGDTANTFHTIVATCTAYDSSSDLATVKVYVDGVLKVTFDADASMTQTFKSTFCFGGPFEKVSGRAGWESRTPFYDLTGNMDVAFQDVRFFTRILSDAEAEAYATAYPAAASATCSINDYQFRHNFTSGSLAVEGSGFSDSGMAGTGTAVDDPVGFGTATFPSNAGYGTIDGGLNRDWTAAMTFRSSTTLENAILLCLGGTYQGGTRGLVVRTSTTEGQLKVSTVQNYGGTGSSSVNTSNNGTLTGLGDTASDFHTLVVVYSRNQKTAQGTIESGATNESDLRRDWVTGVFSFYWDGEWAGSLSTWNGGTSKTLMDTMTYGTLYGNRPSDYVELTDSSSGVAFRDFRFSPKVWTSIEAQAYTKATSPLKDYLFRYNFTTGEKVYTHNGHSVEPVGEWSGFTAVNGPGGYGTAVHPCGVGTIADGENVLNNGDWSVAMSVKPGMLERGLFLGIGGTRLNSAGRELCFLSSSTPGRIRVVSRQTYNYGSSRYYNEPAALDVTGIGDTSNTFHTVVATCSKYENNLATVKVYVDGTLKGTFDADASMTQTFKSSFMFSAAYENTDASGWGNTPYCDVTATMDTAFRDLRFFSRILGDDEIAQYAEIYPAAQAAAGDIDDYAFRHDFSTGKLAVVGAGYVDDSSNPMSGTGTKVMGAVDGSRYAVFPDSTRYGTIDGGLNRDWTCAMSVKPGTVASGSGVLICLGGVRDGNRRSLVVCSTPTEGELRIAIPQNWGVGKNTTGNNGFITGLGDTVNEYHSLVIAHARDQRTLKSTIDGNSHTGSSDYSGVITFYWDGEFAGTLATHDGATSRPFMDTMQYGTIFNEIPTAGNYGYQTLTDESCGTAFQDLRFSTKVWSSAEARAYAARFPASRQANTPGFTIYIR